MNNEALKKAIGFLDMARGILEDLQSDEQEKYDENSEKEGWDETSAGITAADALSALNDALDSIESACDNLNELTGG